MSTALMARKPKRDPKTVAIAKAILEHYQGFHSGIWQVHRIQKGTKEDIFI